MSVLKEERRTQLLDPINHFLCARLEASGFLDVDARLRVVRVEDVDLAKVDPLAEDVHPSEKVEPESFASNHALVRLSTHARYLPRDDSESHETQGCKLTCICERFAFRSKTASMKARQASRVSPFTSSVCTSRY